MQLKQNHEAGTCQVNACAYPTAAIADGRTFFSKKASPKIELCEEHLFKAQDMATEQGLELVWKEYKVYKAEAAAASGPPETALVPVVDKLKAELVQESTQAEAVLSQINEFEIVTKDDLVFAAEVLVETKTSMKRIDDKRKEITGPLNEALRAANALFKPVITFYEKCEKILKQKIAAAHTQAGSEAKAALESAAEAAAAGDGTGVTEALQAHDDAVEFPETDGIQYRKVWKFEITDESQIPREFMTPNTLLISGVVLNKKGATNIPGVRVFEDKIIAVRAS